MVSTRTLSRHAASHDELAAWLDTYDQLLIDIGTGDGAYALDTARRSLGMAVLGADTCLDNLAKGVRRPLPNLRFIPSDATAIPAWLHGRATSISINFPYGSLLHAVAGGDSRTWERLLAAARPGAQIGIRVNESAGAEYGLALEEMQEVIGGMLREIAPHSAKIEVVPQSAMRAFPSTWAKRLAYGRPSRVIVVSAKVGL